jgi:N-formylglutamate amidohydrolase
MNAHYQIRPIECPVIATAIHDGHFIDDQLRPFLLLDETQRFREEDPYTSYMAAIPASQAIVSSSRFQCDFNRPPEQAIYKKPGDAWGLRVWRGPLPDYLQLQLIDYYHAFYKKMKMLIETTLKKFEQAVLLDIHSYNHRRKNPYETAEAASHPEINLGTAYNEKKWRPLCEKMLHYLAHCQINGSHPDVRENIIFKGGWLARWAIKNYGDRICTFSLEFKKTFMDEWTGRGYWEHILDIQKALAGSIPLLTNELITHKIV